MLHVEAASLWIFPTEHCTLTNSSPVLSVILMLASRQLIIWVVWLVYAYFLGMHLGLNVLNFSQALQLRSVCNTVCVVPISVPVEPWPTSSHVAGRPCPTCTLTPRQDPIGLWLCCRQRYRTVRRFTMRWGDGGVCSHECAYVCTRVSVICVFCTLDLSLILFAFFKCSFNSIVKLL